MNLFSRTWAAMARGFREVGAGVTRRTPGALSHWLSMGPDDVGKMNDPYGLSPWVQRAVKHISGPISQVDLRFYEDSTGKENEISDPALKAFWRRPGKATPRGMGMSRYDLMEATVGWLCLKGEFFWLMDDSWMVAGAKKSPVLVARPDRMTPVVDDGELLGWVFQDGSGRRWELIPENVVSSSFWNPVDEFRGAAPMDAARMAAESDYASAKFWKALAEANGDLGENVIAPNGIDPGQVDQIKRAMRAKRAAARRGKFEPMFLVGDLKTEAAKIQSPDAAAVTQRAANRQEIYIAFGVPPSFAEVTASYSVGSASDRYKLIEETCMPMAVKIAEAVEVVSARLLGRSVVAEFDFSDHSTMQQVRSERLEAGRKMHERGIPWNVISSHLDLGLEAFPGWETAWLPFNLMAVEGPAVVPAAAGPVVVDGMDEGKVFDELEELLRTPCAVHGGEALEDKALNSKHEIRNEDQMLRAGVWERQMRVRAAHVKRLRTVVDKAIFQARTEMLRKLADAAGEKGMAAKAVVKSGAFDFLFDLLDFLKVLVEGVMRASYGAYEAAGTDLMTYEMPAGEDGKPDTFIPADPLGLKWLRARENFIRAAGDDMWATFRDALDEGIQVGETFEELAARIREKSNEMSKTQSMRIAVTETGIAFESGRHEAMIQAGVQWKEWLTSGDERVRLSHAALGGKIMAMDEPFLVGGVPMMYPCDPAGTPAEIVNCRCVHGPALNPPDPADIEGNDPTTPIPF